MADTTSPSQGLRKLLFTALKLAVAVVVIWWVLRGVAWNDTVQDGQVREGLKSLARRASGHWPLILRPGRCWSFRSW
jgi:hypothetical protein